MFRIREDFKIDNDFFQIVKEKLEDKGLNLLINNAAVNINTFSNLLDTTRGDLQSHFDVNCTGNLFLILKNIYLSLIT